MVFESLFESTKNKNEGTKKISPSLPPVAPKKRKRKHSRPKKNKPVGTKVDNATISSQPKHAPRKSSRGPRSAPSHEAMQLSRTLKELSTQKRLKEILEVYNDKSNDNIRDGHHACIVVDCCARCGCIQKGEEIVERLKREGEEINVQTTTALLKGYAHSGMMDKAIALYVQLSKKRNARDRPNIRTLNTALRGCMWAAATYKVDGANRSLTSEYIWPSSSSNNRDDIIPDTSSYEYSISILAQALRCEDAHNRLGDFMDAFKVKITNKNTNSSQPEGGKYFTANDPSVLETLGVCFFNIARAHAVLENHSKAIEFANNALNVVASARSFQDPQSKNQIQAGGKRAWRSSTSGDRQANREGNDNSRRSESNFLFRNHKLNELERNARMILNSCKNSVNSSESSQSLARFLITRVIYFSGGGTTDLSASSSTSNADDKMRGGGPDDERQHIINALWFCFGLRAAMEKEFPTKHFATDKKGEVDFSSILGALKMKKSHILLDNGSIDFGTIFKRNLCSETTGRTKRPLNIELGSGFGEWAVNQAVNTPDSDYVAVELRSDRVGQMFSKAFLRDCPVQNLCCIGSECGSFLRKRVNEESVSKIFVNHPEPPTQTFGANTSVLNKIADGGEEPAHMLNSQTLITAAKCLDSKTGELIIVTDNRFYANLICATLVKVMNSKEGLFFSAVLKRQSGMQKIQTFDGKSKHAKVFLYEGQPNESIGHTTTASNASQKGSTYFDRLWRKGAGNHAQTFKRFIICMHRYAPTDSTFDGNIRKIKVEKDERSSRQGSKKKRKKRNERRLKRKSAALT